MNLKVDTRSAETVRDRERVGGEGGGDLFNSHIDIVYAIARPRGGGGGGGCYPYPLHSSTDSRLPDSVTDAYILNQNL